MTKNRVLLAAPTFYGKEYCLREWMACIFTMREYANVVEEAPSFDVMIVDNSPTDRTEIYHKHVEEFERRFAPNKFFYMWVGRKYDTIRENISTSQEIIRSHVVANKYSHLFFLESDVVTHPRTLQRLMEAKKPVVGAVHYRFDDGIFAFIASTNKGVNNPLLMRQVSIKDFPEATRPEVVKLKDGTSSLRFKDVPFSKETLLPITMVAFGCTLIETKVLEDIKFYVHMGVESNSDVHFSKECLNRNVEMWWDTSSLTHHLVDEATKSGWGLGRK